MSRQKLVDQWSQIEGPMSISGIKDQYIKENLAILLTNQSMGGTSLNESFGMGVATGGLNQGYPADGAYGSFAPVALALQRRVHPDLFANNFVGVQALSGPVGLAYALRFVYAGTTTEAGWKEVPKYSGFSGSTCATSGTADAGTGADTSAAEPWQVGTMPNLSFKMDRVAVIAKTRKLAASFSLEAAMDIEKMQGVDIEREMLAIMQYEVQAEKDREIIGTCKSKCTTANGNLTTYEFSATSGFGSDGRWSQEKYTNVVTQIIYASEKIAMANKRGAGNVVVVSPRVATALQAAGPIFSRLSIDINVQTQSPMAYIGTINNQLKVYRDQYATTDYALVAYKGAGVSDAGIIYCPYVMGITNKAIDPNDFSPRIGVMERYGMVDSLLGAENYYSLINFNNMSTLMG